jgi:hypothetical protein
VRFWPRRRGAQRALAAVLVLAVLAAVSGFVVLTRSSTPAKAAPDGTPVTKNISVELPHGANPSNYHLSTGPATQQALASLAHVKVDVLVAPRDFHSSKPVPSGTKLVFQTDRNLPAGSPVFEAYYDPLTGQWVADPTTYNPATGVAVATVPHFSIHGLFTWPWQYIKSAMEGAVNNLLDGFAFGAHNPSCGSQNGVQLQYNGSMSSVGPCLEAQVVSAPSPGNRGMANVTLKLTNKRDYPISVFYPNYGSASVNSTATVAEQIGGWLTKMSSEPRGQRTVLVPGGAAVSVHLDGVRPPFKGMFVSAEFDGEAYLTGILGTALDELGAILYKAPETLVKTLVDGYGGESVIYRDATEFDNVTSLTPAVIRTLTDVGLDTLVAAYQSSGSFVLSVVKVVLSLANDIVQTVELGVDQVMGATDHEYAFGTYGHIWDPVTVSALHSVDWSSVTIPGGWFKGPATVTLHPGIGGEADNVQTSIPPLPGTGGSDQVVTVYADSANVTYGTFNGADVAVMCAQAQNGGTADSVRAEACIVFSGTPTNLHVVGVMTAQSGWPNYWSPNPKQAENVTLLNSKGVTISPNEIQVNETYYRSTDITAGPSGRAVTTWQMQGGTLVPTGTQILQ